ncbi:hypothetical protein GDO86_009929 [Hymenochirus boettgeri]|uniref:Major facilitator superfamily (MFS) profile domain-containing protein n=1 Tax=Hymenochirus boettgeri TaxID=247094 RepID=A0A8T2JL05_9PIPI|nr:hypothetical protein GDO86_009929 [Hymenochirus boettgeri]
MDSQADRVLGREKKLTNAVIGFIFLLSGIEYAVILPTIWMYLQSLDAEPFYLGLVLSAFSFTELLVGPLFGYWSDRTGKTKSVIILSNCFEIAGFGSGAGASIFGYLTRVSSTKERAAVFAMAMACRQVGLLIGPAFNVFLRYSNFKLGPFHVNKFSAPGIFMCVLWTLMQPLVVFMFHDSSLKYLKTEEDEYDPLLVNETENSNEGCNRVYGAINYNGNQTIGTPFSSANDTAALLSHSSEDDLDASFPNTIKDQDHKNFEKVCPNGQLSELLREEVVVLLAAQFVTLFNQTALETLVTPLAQTYLGFQDLHNSLLYFMCGIEMLIGFLVVRILSRCSSDRLLLAFGLFICNISCIWCLVFMAKPRVSYRAWPPVIILGFNHGFRRSIGGLATILGPLWAAGLTDDLYIMLGVMMSLLVLLTAMVCFSYRSLIDPNSSEIQSQ